MTRRSRWTRNSGQESRWERFDGSPCPGMRAMLDSSLRTTAASPSARSSSTRTRGSMDQRSFDSMSADNGMSPEVLKGHLDLLLLSAVGETPAHGYAIAETLRVRSRQAFDLPEGTLYPALHRLERSALLSSRWSDESGRRRRVYQLTAKGRRPLEQRRRERRDFRRAGHALAPGPTSPPTPSKPLCTP